MVYRKYWMVALLALLLFAIPTVASAQIELPDRVIEVKLETAMAAQQAVMEEIMTGGEIQINITI
jgi:hypothetical protein